MNKGSDIIFLADQSDPMENKIDALKMAMKFFLKGIPVEWCFNLWCFGSSHEKLWEGARQYNKKSLKEAERYVARWEANMGGTKLRRALHALVASLRPEVTTDIIVLTDGDLWDADPIVDLARSTTEQGHGRVRFFALGIGDRVSRGWIDKIGEHGRGYSEIVSHSNPVLFAERVVAVLQAAKTRHVGSIRLQLDGNSIEPTTNHTGEHSRSSVAFQVG